MQMMQMMEMMQWQASGGMSKAMAEMQTRESPDMLWKSTLHHTLVKNSLDEKPVYEATEDGNRKWVGTVALLGNTYTAKESGPNKKAAEQFAAKAALKALYPAEFKKHNNSKGGFDPWMIQQMMEGKQQQKGGAKTGDQDQKSKLVHSVQLLMLKNLGRSLIKGDIQWEIQESEGDKKKYTATVTITQYEGGHSSTGQACDSKKKAEKSAAQAAYKALKSVLVPLEEENTAKQKKKNQEELEALKKRVAEKKEAAKAAVA